MILWIDLETTGTDPIMDGIIEIGAILTREDETLTEISRFQRVYKPGVEMARIDPVVFQMHVENGLWLEALMATDYADSKVATEQIMGWLGGAGAFKADRLVLAGSGVAHFDIKFIESKWQPLYKRLAYYQMDIGSVRRLARLGGAAFNFGIEPEAKMHRALDDIWQHIHEARGFIKACGEIASRNRLYAVQEK